jgi:ABC-type glycerol-3-phosphate transport system substrate-binding protein
VIVPEGPWEGLLRRAAPAATRLSVAGVELQERDFLPPLLTAGRSRGQTFAVHAEADVAGLWYRRAALGALGLDPPATWAERALGRLLAVAAPDGLLPKTYVSGTGAWMARHWFAWPAAILTALALGPPDLAGGAAGSEVDPLARLGQVQPVGQAGAAEGGRW